MALPPQSQPSIPWWWMPTVAGLRGPQGPDEPDAGYWLRSTLTGIGDTALGRAFSPYRQGARASAATFDTPRRREQARAQAAQPGFLDAALAAARGAAQPARPASAAATPTLPGNPFAGISNNARGWRNNNPGNLEASEWTRLQPGFVRSDGRFAVFATPEAGIAAQERLLRGSRRYFGGGQRSINQILDAYAPSGDNAPQARANYASYLSRSLGVSPDQPLDASYTSRLAAAMREFENGQQRGGPATGPGAVPPGMEAWNQYAGMAMGEIDQAQAAAMQPTNLSFSMPAPPQLPAPAHYQAPDFTAGNKAFEAARPRAPFAEPGSEVRLLRENFFRGMAEGLLSINPNAPIGFGSLLMRAGAGALSGRMRGADEVRQRQDRYDALLQQYNMAASQRNDTQATSTANVINQNIQLDNEHARAQAAQNLQDFYRRNRVDVQGNSVVVYSGEGDRQQVHVVPIQSMVAQQFGVMRAQALLQGAGAAQQNSQWGFQLANNLALQYAALGIAGGNGPAEQGEALAHALGSVVVPLTDSGALQNVIGRDNYNTIRSYFESSNPLDPTQIQSPEALARREQQMHDYIATRVIRDAMNNPQLARQLLTINAGVAGRAVERVRSERTTTRRSRSGVSTSTSYQASDE